MFGYSSGDKKTKELLSYEEPHTSPSSLAGNKTFRTIKIKRSNPHSFNSTKEDVVNNSGMSKTTKGTKLVIQLGGQSGNIGSLPRSELQALKRNKIGPH